MLRNLQQILSHLDSLRVVMAYTELEDVAFSISLRFMTLLTNLHASPWRIALAIRFLVQNSPSEPRNLFGLEANAHEKNVRVRNHVLCGVLSSVPTC